jgi:hypothetical protein
MDNTVILQKPKIKFIIVKSFCSRQTENTPNIMDIIEQDDLYLLQNYRIKNMSRIDWAKTMAVSNQYIQRNILRALTVSSFNHKQS